MTTTRTRTARTFDGPVCPVCRVNERSYDNEPGAGGGYFSQCDRCFWLVASRPTCPSKGCQIGGHTAPQCELVNVPVGGIAVELAEYRCASCDRTGTRARWATFRGRIGAQVDRALVAAGTCEQWLIDGRRKSATETLEGERWNAEAKAYAAAYLEGTAS